MKTIKAVPITVEAFAPFAANFTDFSRIVWLRIACTELAILPFW